MPPTYPGRPRPQAKSQTSPATALPPATPATHATGRSARLPALLFTLFLLPLAPAPLRAAETVTPITSDSTQPLRLTIATGTQIYDVAEGATYTWHNLATGGTAAIALTAANTGLIIRGGGTTVFTSNTNTTTVRGGAISSVVTTGNGIVDLANVIFGDKNNPALGNYSAAGGGAINVNAGTLRIVNGEFHGNRANTTGGGAIYAGAFAVFSMTNAVFEANTTPALGGAIYVGSTIAYTLANVRFGAQGDPARGNIAGDRGGALTLNGGALNLNDGEFYGNTATTGGGALYIGGNVNLGGTLARVAFEQNSTGPTGIGGAIYINSNPAAITTITSATFGNPDDLSLGNHSGTSGGAIHAATARTIIKDTGFYGNHLTAATGAGGALRVLATATVTLTDVVFVSNTAAAGGAIHLATTGTATPIQNALFDRNRATTNGGALYLTNASDGATITTATFTGNTAAGLGGAIYLEGNATAKPNTLTLADTLFASNTAIQGGAIYSVGTNARITLDNPRFTGNTGTGAGGGGALVISGGSLALNLDTTAAYTGNTAPKAGFLLVGSAAKVDFNLAPAVTLALGDPAAPAADTIASNDTASLLTLNRAPGRAGTLILAADSTAFTGTFDILAGRLLLGGTGAKLGGHLTVAPGATFGGQGTFTRATIATGGTLQLGLDGATGVTQYLTPTGTLALARDTAIVGSGRIGSGGAIWLDAGTITASTAATQWMHIDATVTGPGALLKTGDGTFGLSGSNTFAGGLTLASGTLRLGHNHALGTGTLAITGSGAVVGLTLSGGTIANNILLAAPVVFDNAVPFRLSGTITGPGAITKIGSARLNLAGTLVNIPAVAITGGQLAGNLTTVPLVTLTNTAAYAGNLARAAGQTLSIATGSIIGNLALSQGARLEFDLADAGPGPSLGISGTLAATGTTTINLLHLGNATYTVLSAGTLAATAANFLYTVNGDTLTGRNSILPAFTSTNLTLAATYRNLRMTWAGASGALWDTTAQNWNDTDTSAYGETRFVTGDSIRFPAAATGTVVIAPAGVTAGDIEIAATGALTFTGGTLATASSSSSLDGNAGYISLGSSGSAAATGKLVKKGAGKLTLDNAAGLFAAGLDLEAGTLAFNRAAQLGAPTGTVTFTGPSTLRAAADIAGPTGTLAGTLALAAGVSGTLDTQAFTVESAAVLAGTGTLVKTGAGKLILRATDNTAFAATVNVAAGSLLLADGAKLGAPLTISPGATAGGDGTFTAAVTVNNATLLVGAADNAASAPGTLTLAGPLTLTGSARVQFAIHPGGAADTLNLTAPITTATASNIIALTLGVIASGTYPLGNATALAAVQNLEVNGVPIDDTLRIVSKLSAPSGTLLYIHGADDSRYMEWTGATGTARWNIGLANWQGYNGDTAGKTKFQDGDTIRFATTAAHTIAIDTPVTVSDLIVDNTGTLTLTGAALTAAPAGTAITGTLITAPAGKLVKNGPGALTLANTANTFPGGVELNAGLVSISFAAQLNTAGTGLTLSSGTLRALAPLALSDTLTLAPNFAANSAANSGVREFIPALDGGIYSPAPAASAPAPDTGAAALDTGAHAVTLTGGIAGTGTLAKLGAGALTLSAATAGANLLSPAATTRIVDGAVLLRDFTPAAAAATAHTFILDGGFLDLSLTPGFNATTGAGANDWTNLRITGTGGAVIGSNDKLTLRDGDTLAHIGGTTTAQQGIYLVIDAGPTGAATLAGPNTYAGRTLLQSGTLRLATDNALGLLTLNREVRFTGSGAALEITGDGFVSNRPLALDENATLSVAPDATATWSGPITAPGKTLAKAGAGTLVLTNTGNSASLSYHIADGVLETTPAALAARAVTADAGGTLALNLATSATHTPNLTGPGAFEKRGPGQLTLAAALGHTGPVRVLAGTLKTTAANQFAATSPLHIAPGATLDLRGTRQTAATLALDAGGTLLMSATVDSTAGVILASDFLKLTGGVTGTGTIAVTLAEADPAATAAALASINPPPTSIVLVESAAAVADLAINITGAPADAIFGWDITRDAGNYLLGQKRLVPVIPAVLGVNAALLIGAETTCDALIKQITTLRLHNDGGFRAGKDWWLNATYRHDTINETLYAGADAITKAVQAGVSFTRPGARRWAAGVYVDFVETHMRLTDAATATKTNSGGIYLTYQPNYEFHVDLITRLSTGHHRVEAAAVPFFDLDTTGLGAAVAIGYAFTIKSGWQIEPQAQIAWNNTAIDTVQDAAHRVYDAGNIVSFRERLGLQFTRLVMLGEKMMFRPVLRVAYNHEFKGNARASVLRYHDTDRHLLRDRHDCEDDLGGGSFLLGAGAALRLNDRLEAWFDASAGLGGKLEDYTLNLAVAWRW